MEFWTVGQLSKLANVTIRTIRYYDQIQLLTPEFRHANGRRYYTEKDLKRLEKICLLKSLSVSLDDIKAVLDKKAFKELLLHQQHQTISNIREAENTLKNIQTLLNSIEIEGDLDWEPLLPLIKRKEHYRDQFFSKEERKTLDKLPKMEKDNIQTKQWINLIKRIELTIKKGFPAESEEGKLIAEDCLLLSELIFEGNKDLEEKFWEVRKSAADSSSAGLYPVKEEILIFLEEAIASLNETGCKFNV
ncbi:MerR family transcriptional regulator [Peribacillus simplex]|uniref:MerR family transcriptional regulator n=1 Tax=Peribacillus simplex TaxID=1478 RepID=UPI00298E27C3|nr:MerR family transcriptional regulator [Peribacillus simplex]MDW7613957.1 MerR family transcriptional regulator [Peribacillus simplex]